MLPIFFAVLSLSSQESSVDRIRELQDSPFFRSVLAESKVAAAKVASQADNELSPKKLSRLEQVGLRIAAERWAAAHQAGQAKVPDLR